MTWNNDGKRVRRIRTTDCLKAAARPNPFCKLLIADCCAVRNSVQLFPYTNLKWRSNQIRGNSELRKLAVEVAIELVNGFFVARFVVDDIVVIEVLVQPDEEIFSVLLGHTDLARTFLR